MEAAHHFPADAGNAEVRRAATQYPRRDSTNADITTARTRMRRDRLSQGLTRSSAQGGIFLDVTRHEVEVGDRCIGGMGSDASSSPLTSQSGARMIRSGLSGSRTSISACSNRRSNSSLKNGEFLHVSFWRIPLKKSRRDRVAASRFRWTRRGAMPLTPVSASAWGQLCEFPEVLGCGCEGELITCSVDVTQLSGPSIRLKGRWCVEKAAGDMGKRDAQNSILLPGHFATLAPP
jgi:hypothetical protein